MAATRIMSVHVSKALGAAQTVKNMTDYFKNPDKTDGGRLVSGFELDTDIIAEEFMLARDEYRFTTGRDQGDSEVLAYHVRQAFVPGEVDADTAHQLGHELAMELSQGNFAFMVCTHIDRGHIHNHIAINSVNLDCTGKYRDIKNSWKRSIQKISDRISRENGLHVVENPGFGKGYNQRYKVPTKRDGLTEIIDDVLENTKPKDFEDFLKQLVKAGCKVKHRGKTISIQPPNAERFFRLKAGKKGLPIGYDEESLRKKIAEMQTDIPVELLDSTEEILTAADAKTTAAAIPAQPTIPSHDKKINLIINLENSLKAQDSPNYKRWASGFNLQQAAETLLFLQTHNLTDMDALTHATTTAKTDYASLRKRIDTADTRITQVNNLQRHIGAYSKNKDVYTQYLRSKRSPKFRQENEKAIATVEGAKAFFDSMGLDNLPSINDLREEYSALAQEKYNCHQAINGVKQLVSDLQSAKKNVEMLLGIAGEPTNERAQRRGLHDDR